MTHLSYNEALWQSTIKCPICNNFLRKWSSLNDLSLYCTETDNNIYFPLSSHFICNLLDYRYAIEIRHYPFSVRLESRKNTITNTLSYLNHNTKEYKIFKSLNEEMTTIQAIDLINNLDHLKLFI